MNKPVVAIVCGTRPEIIKLAPLRHALAAQGWADPLWIHTGQHGAMADPILECFDIEPDVRLERRGDSLQAFSSGCRPQLDEVLAARRVDICVVQGDTERAFLGALAGFYQRIPVAHVEAGLRTGDLERPFPEEGIRQMISRISARHFAPTPRARLALIGEGIDPSSIELVGNTVVDAQLWARARHGARRGVEGRGHILVTIHRRESLGREMEEMFAAIADIALARPDMNILFPVHLNPAVGDAARARLSSIPNVELCEPLNYLRMQQALADSALLLTDSGGLQEEAPTWGVPTLVLREETERPEAVEAGCALLVGSNRSRIAGEALRLLSDDLAYRRMQHGGNPFGDGHASERIADSLGARFFKPPSALAA